MSDSSMKKKAMMELDIENPSITENRQIRRSENDILMKIIDEYLEVDSKEKEYSKLLLKVVQEQVDLHLSSNRDQNIVNKLAKLGLDESEYLTLKALPVADPLYVKLFLNGVITREQLQSKSGTRNSRFHRLACANRAHAQGKCTAGARSELSEPDEGSLFGRGRVYEPGEFDHQRGY